MATKYISSRIGIAVLASLLCAFAAHAQTWDGGSGVDSNFNTSSNWNPNAVPVNNGTANLIFAGAVRLTPVVNLNFDVNGVTFNNTAGAFSIGSNGGSTLTVRGGGITNNDADTQTFTTPVAFAAGSSITATSGHLNFTGQMSLGNTVTVSGGFDTFIDGIGGTGAFVKNGAGAMNIAPIGSQNYGLTLNDGTVNFSASVTFAGPSAHISVSGGTLAPASNLTLSSGATLDVPTATNFAMMASRTMTVQSAAAATFGTSLTTAAGSIYRVTGTGSSFTTGGLTVRDAALVEVLVNSSFTTNAGSFVVGSAGTPGAVRVDGVGSSFTCSGASSASVGSGTGSTGSLTFSNGATGSFASISLLLGPSSSSTGTMVVKSGAQVTTGTVEVANIATDGTASLLVTGPGSKLTATFNIADFSIGATSGSVGTVTVADGGELDLKGPLTINETGTLNLNGGIITMASGQTFTNNGVLNFNAGRITLGENLNIGGGVSSLGTNITLQPGKDIVVPSNRTTTIGTAGALVLDGGSLSTGTIVRSGGTIDFRRGTLNLTGTTTLVIGASGPLGANVTLPIGVTLNATSTTTDITSTGVLTVSGGTLSSQALTNQGILVIDSGSASFNVGTNFGGGQVYIARNLAISGTFTNNVGGRVELAGGTGRITGPNNFVNDGLLTGNGTLNKGVSNNANGEIRAEAGKTLSFTGVVAANAGKFSLQGGTLDFLTAITNGNTGFIAGRGTLVTGGLTNQGVMAFSGGTADIFGDVTNGAGSRIITSGAGSVTTFYDDMVHNGLEIYTGAGASTVLFGALSGGGPFTGTGTVYSVGDLRPGNSPAIVSFGGNLVLGNFAQLQMEIGGTTPGTQYDRLVVAGQLSLGGALNVSLINGFTPAIGNSFDLLDFGSRTGTFSAIQLPTLPPALSWDDSNIENTGVLAVIQTGASQWRLASGGTWGVGTNWIGGLPSISANFLGKATSPATITLDGPRIAQGLRFDNPSQAYTIISGVGGTLTLNNGANPIAIDVVSGSHTIASPLSLAGNTAIATAAGASLQLSGPVVAGGITITKSGPGNLQIPELSGVSLVLSGGSTAVLPSASMLNLDGLSIAPGATLDLLSGDMVLNYSGSAPYATYSALIQSGGIGTSLLHPTPGTTTAIALVDNHMLHITVWDGRAISDGVGFSQLLFAYTYLGDVNLDGQVDVHDYVNIIANMGRSNATWFEGDVNRDGVVTLDDLGIVRSNLGAGVTIGQPLVAIFGPASAVAVPEPAGLGALGCVVLGLCRRRRI